MECSRASQAADTLQAYLQATDEGEAQRAADCLIHGCAGPVIREVLQRRYRVSLLGAGRSRLQDEQEAQEIYDKVIDQLLDRLHRFKHEAVGEAIRDMPGYVAVMTNHACDQRLRLKYPQRWRLRNRLHYVLTRHEGFALWQSERKEWIGGFAAWREASTGRPRPDRLQRLHDDPREFRRAFPAVAADGCAHPGDLLAALFDWVGAPVELEELVDIVADLWDLHDRPAPGDERRPPLVGPHEQIPDPRANVEDEVGRRAYLERLWAEVRQLPPRQCAALLLNLRDREGRGVLPLLPLIGVASVAQILEALAMPTAQFAVLWDALPLDDETIARHLDTTRPKVINLRKVARERLKRRMQAAGYEAGGEVSL